MMLVGEEGTLSGILAQGAWSTQALFVVCLLRSGGFVGGFALLLDCLLGGRARGVP